ncbi:pyruvate, phosphate dikinase [Candidatus Scalindua japonica]|uniref:Pyruvate, phosphate dikinase n=1 Tax=Candidatus Scalindua japonica TaxID=1284222 RepID=A0A286U405_9BACT|nr:pyruvate, phosphate dikinase [Candidatus Scalindua japonica]GAX62857.1 pyruvate, phosphate dikinase [Candidatus Scalindua japonica]
MKKKYIYFFGNNKADGNARMKDLLGGKGANLAEMANLGFPVPPGFTITTEACDEYNRQNKKFPTGLQSEIDKNLTRLEREMGAKLGDPNNPLLVSVRSGAAASMPGMMDTVLNLGLNPDSIQGLINKTNNERFPRDAYRRFINMFGNVVMGMKHHDFEEIIARHKKKAKVENDTDLNAEQLKNICKDFIAIYKKRTGSDFPLDPKEQLRKAIIAVFDSWNNPRAVKYRKIYDISGLLGTAVNIQAMVFGNTGNNSATGVCFTRNPSNGENKFYGEFLLNAQGEDVVAGIRTPEPISDLAKELPIAYKKLVNIKNKLEKHYKDLQDIEFTIQEGKLFMLQTRNGKRTTQAAVKIAVDMVKEKLIDKKTAINRIEPNQLDQLLHPTFNPKAKRNVIASGLPASPGAASGKVTFHADEAEKLAAKNEKIILVRIETSPEDIGGMHVAQGILTTKGGMTSHAAVVARGMGTCCVAGCGGIQVDYEKEEFTVGEKTIKKGDYISLDGTRGEVILGQVPTVEPTLCGDFGKLMKWTDEFRRLKVRTNADTPEDAQRARDFGAEGIGLCRTEHMFFGEDRIDYVRQMILTAGNVTKLKISVNEAKAELNKAPKKKLSSLNNKKNNIQSKLKESQRLYKGALNKLLPMQRSDFTKIFKVMNGFPVTIRLLDPPLHEFLPNEKHLQIELAKKMGMNPKEVKDRVDSLHETNPMLGLRGCRLGITYPDIYEMQVKAIIQAACAVKKQNIKVFPEIMVPLVGTDEEMKVLKNDIKIIAEKVLTEKGAKINYKIGTMIEIPRAALTADRIAKYAEFFSFGTNDLTQMTFGYSRDDVGSFVPQYTERGLLEKDPFQVLDQDGVGQLVTTGIKKGRQTKPDLKIGICGEHGGEPSSIQFCNRNGMDYVSCSPFRVPIARLSSAQSAIKEKQ